MNIEEIRSYCLTFACVEECFPFDSETLVMKVGGKMFAVLPLEKPGLVIVKCDPEWAIELRERHAGINAAWHFNKKHWNQIDFTGPVARQLVEQCIAHSYQLVAASLPRKTRRLLNMQ